MHEGWFYKYYLPSSVLFPIKFSKSFFFFNLGSEHQPSLAFPEFLSFLWLLFHIQNWEISIKKTSYIIKYIETLVREQIDLSLLIVTFQSQRNGLVVGFWRLCIRESFGLQLKTLLWCSNKQWLSWECLIVSGGICLCSCDCLIVSFLVYLILNVGILSEFSVRKHV